MPLGGVVSNNPIPGVGKSDIDNSSKGASVIGNAISGNSKEVRQIGADLMHSHNTPTEIDFNSFRATKGFNSRIRFLVMHYTAADFKGSVSALTGGNVSAHYLVPDPTDKSYIDAGYKDMRVFGLVAEKDRAWHAGVSSWSNRGNINDTSIGIEIVNQASDDGHGHITFPTFNSEQVLAVKELSLDIIRRNPDITPSNVVGHSDISLGRKSDPGASFPWEELHNAGVGAWYDQETKNKYELQFSREMPEVHEVVSRLGKYGYSVTNASSEKGLNDLVRAFQLHFRQADYSGVIDAETAAIIYALVDRYCARQ